MPIVFIPRPYRDLTGGVSEVALEGRTVGEVVEALERRYPGIKARLCRGESLAPGLQVSIDDVMTTRGLRAALQPDSEVHFLPAIGGGSGDRPARQGRTGPLPAGPAGEPARR
jgi:molybdopterin synthase sulfur carrier subunit